MTAAILLSPTIASAQQTRFEDEANNSQVKKNSFPSLMEESLSVLYKMEQFITQRAKTAEGAFSEALLRKLKDFKFTQNPDDLDDDQKETLSLAKITLKDVISLLEHQLSAADTVTSVGRAHNRTVYNLMARRGEIESQLATIRLRGLHYSHPGHGLNQAIKASYEAMSLVAYTFEDNPTPTPTSSTLSVTFEGKTKALDEGITAGRFALSRWRFRSSTSEGEKQENLLKLADSYDASFGVEEKVLAALNKTYAEYGARRVLDKLLGLEVDRIAARDARIEMAKKKN